MCIKFFFSPLLNTWGDITENSTSLIFIEFIDRQFICWHKCVDTYCVNIKYVQMAALSINLFCSVLCNMKCITICNILFKLLYNELCNLIYSNIGYIVIVTKHISPSAWSRYMRGADWLDGGIIRQLIESLMMQLK